LFAFEAPVEKLAERLKQAHALYCNWRGCVKVDVNQSWVEKRDADFESAL